MPRAPTYLVVLSALLSLAGPTRGAETADQQKMRQAFDRTIAGYASMPREGFDPDAVIEKLGRDPERLLDWVRAQTRFVPYQGALRGPSGVLMDRVGSDLDRSLLLAQLVSSSGYTVRLARVDLPEPVAKKRLADALAQPLPQGPVAKPTSPVGSLNEWSAAQAQAILGLLPKPGADPDGDARRLAAAADHWWVQYQVGDQWTDLDPAADKPGAHLGGDPTELLDCAVNDIAANVPADMLHRVTLRVVVERWEEAGLKEDLAVEETVTPSKYPVRHVYLINRAEDDAAGIDPADDAATARRKMLEQKKWRPFLAINGAGRGPMTFDDTGVLAAAQSGAARLGGAAQGAMGQGFDALSGGGDDAPPASVLTAEWLDLVISSPGSAQQIIRCEVFDSLGPAARAAASIARPEWDELHRLGRAAALSALSDNLITGSRFSGDLLRHQINTRVVESKDALLAALADTAAPQNRQAIMSAIMPHPLEAFSFARSFSMGAEDQTYIDRPNVVRLIAQWRVTPDGSLRKMAMADLACNSTSSLTSDPAAGYRACVRRGIADTVVESIAVGKWAGSAQGSAPPTNTRAVFERAAEQSISTSVCRNLTDLESLDGLSEDVKQRLSTELQAGQIVIVPSRPPGGGRTGWWRVDPASGQAVGMMDDGLHADGAEYGETNEAVDDEILTDEQILREQARQQEAEEFFQSVENNMTDKVREDIGWVVEAMFGGW
jgi:hypothetical protein